MRKVQNVLWACLVLSAVTFVAGSAFAQTCLTAGDMDDATKNALTSTAKRYFDMAVRGDAASLKQIATPGD